MAYGILDKRIKELEELDDLRGAQAEHDAFLKQQQAMEKGVVGSGQVSAKEFAKSRGQEVAGASKMDKAAAAAKIAQSMGVAPSEGMAGGAISGAATGFQFGGAPGAAVGAIAGGIMGAAKARAAAKAHNRQLEAQKLRALGEIEQEKGRQLSQAIGSMGARMSASLR